MTKLEQKTGTVSLRKQCLGMMRGRYTWCAWSNPEFSDGSQFWLENANKYDKKLKQKTSQFTSFLY